MHTTRRTRLWVVLVVALTLGTTTAGVTAAADVVTARAATPKVATPKVGACDLLSTDDLGLALGSAFQAGSPFDVGAGTSCGFDAIGPVRGATTRVVRGKAAKTAMATTLKALRDTLRSVDSAPPSKVAGLGDKAFYSLDEFLGEGSIEVLDGKTFVQVTAIVAPNGDQGLVSEAVLSGLAEQALAAAK